MDELLLKYMHEISYLPKLNDSEMDVLFRQKEDPAIFMQLVENNIRLVFQTTLKYRSVKDEEFIDLISEGVIGLKIAVSKFEPDKGFKFSTYAFFWIRKYIFLYLDSCTREGNHSNLNNLVYYAEDSPYAGITESFKELTAKESFLVRVHFGFIRKNSLSKKILRYLNIHDIDIKAILSKLSIGRIATV